MPTPRGERHGKWKGGRRIHQKGYVEITAGRYRWWKEHRAVMDCCLREWNPWEPGAGMLEIEAAAGIEFHVDHQDCDKANNLPGNLILMDVRIHNGFAMSLRDPFGRFTQRPRKRDPDWVEVPIVEDGEEV